MRRTNHENRTRSVKRRPIIGFFGSAFLVLIFAASGQLSAAGVTSVTPSPNSTNQQAQYTVVFTTGNGNTNLDAGVGTITITFGAATFVPASISASLVTVNGQTASVVNVSGQAVTVTTPITIAKNGAAGTVVISAGAGLRNPGTAGTTYTLTVATSAEPTAVTSPNYTIVTTTTQVTAPAVVPDPSVESKNAAYTVTFSVGAGGYLTANTSTITLQFPSGTTVPNGTINGVTVNSSSANATGTAASRTVTITCPVTIANNGGVTIAFTTGSSLFNPTAGTGKILTAYTSSEATVVNSAGYTNSSTTVLSVSAITLGDNKANASTSYTLDFDVSNSGALTANVDSFYVIFPNQTVVPTNIATTNITIRSGGFTDVAASVTVSGQKVFIRTSIAVANSGHVKLTFESGAGIQNPADAGNYTIVVETSQDEEVTSNSYGISAATSTLTQATVALSNTAVSATNVTYTFTFSVGSNGRLISDSSKFRVIFPTGTGYGTLSDSVNGVSGVLTRSGDTVSIKLPASVSIANNAAVTLKIGGITNPGSAGSRTARVYTTVESTPVTSSSFVIGGTSVTVTGVVLGTAGVNQASSYQISCTGVSALANNNNDYVRVVFPVGTTLPASIANGNITFAGGTGQSVSSVTVNQAGRTVDIYVGSNNKTFASVTFATAANIVNPSVPSTTFYNVTVSTTQNFQPANSPAYSVTPNNSSVTAGTVTATPNVISAAAAYQVNFTSTANGKLVGGTSAGSDSIKIEFLSGGTVVPASITAATVSVNGVSCSGVRVVRSGANGIIKVEVPSGQTLAASTQHSVVFSSSSGLVNGGSAGNYTVKVATDADSALSTQTNNLTLSATAQLTITQVTLAPTTQNQNSAYTIKFTTGSANSDTLAVGDTIRIVFPTNTSVPSSIATTRVTVNGVNITSTAVGSGQTLRFLSPVAVGKLTQATVSISTSANTLNPTLVQSNWTLTVSTAQVGGGTAGPATSVTYSTSATTTTISTPGVSRSSSVPSASSNYTITFTTGTNGRLLAGTSTISIVFPSGTTVPANAGSVNGTSATPSVVGQTATFTVPGSVSIGNSGSVTVVVNGLTNPTAGNYTLSAYTSVETGSVSSASYAISNVPSVGIPSVRLAISGGQPTDTVNQAGRYVIYFTTDGTQGALTSGVGTITITFPQYTQVPASISSPSTNVLVNNTGATTVNSNSGTRQVVITTPVGITAGSTDSVIFATGANIINPSLSGTNALTVATSSQPTAATSPNYTTKATTTTLTNVVVTVNPGEPGVLATHSFTFNLGSRGKLVAGVSQIFLLFPFDATFTTGTPITSTVTVNGVAADALSLGLSASQEDTLKVTVPSSLTTVNKDSLTVVVDSTSGLRSSTSTSQQTYKVYTSVETGVASGDFTLPVLLSKFDVTSSRNSVFVSWTTESEINNAYWVVEKAVVPAGDDVALSKLNFTRIEALDGQGTKTSSTDYFYEDTEVLSGVTYAYRLLDVSHDGTMTPHELKKITVSIPDKFELQQNYPNPFNPTTTIRFNLPVASKVSVKVYNLLGQEVAEVTNRVFSAGFHNEVWNGLNNRGERVSSGIYIYRITAFEVDGKLKFSKSRKMMLLK